MVFEWFKELVLRLTSKRVTCSKLRIYELADSEFACFKLRIYELQIRELHTINYEFTD